MYIKFIKRILDFVFSLSALIVFSPIIIFMIVAGSIVMKVNPFFLQPRPGKKEKVFKLIKFRTMTCEKDTNDNLLPDEERLVPYGKFLRASSLDELPELINILKRDMSIVGPRPLLVKYLPYYSEEQKHRHDVRPGLTGYAQANGRNLLSWEERFQLELYYVNNVSLLLDIKILFKTVAAVFKREGISSETSVTMEDFAEYVESQNTV